MSSDYENLNVPQTMSVRVQIAELVFVANARALPARRVPLTAALKVADRVLARSSYTDLTARAFAVERAVTKFITLVTLGARTGESVEHLDLLPVAHPLSTAPSALTASALSEARAEWLAADPRIADELRSLVASAYTLEVGSVERTHALARLEALAGEVPLDLIALVAVGGNSSAARSARARRQLRDRLKRFAFEGGMGGFLVRTGEKVKDKVGALVGGSSTTGIGEVYITEDDDELGLKKGDILPVKLDNYEGLDVMLTDEQLEKAGVKLPSSKVSASKRAQDIEELLANKLEAPSDWKKLPNGDFVTEDGFVAAPKGDLKYELKDENGNVVEGLEAAEWPDIQKYIKKAAEDEFGTGIEDEPSGEAEPEKTYKKKDLKVEQLAVGDLLPEYYPIQGAEANLLKKREQDPNFELPPTDEIIGVYKGKAANKRGLRVRNLETGKERYFEVNKTARIYDVRQKQLDALVEPKPEFDPTSVSKYDGSGMKKFEPTGVLLAPDETIVDKTGPELKVGDVVVTKDGKVRKVAKKFSMDSGDKITFDDNSSLTLEEPDTVKVVAKKSGTTPIGGDLYPVGSTAQQVYRPSAPGLSPRATKWTKTEDGKWTNDETGAKSDTLPEDPKGFQPIGGGYLDKVVVITPAEAKKGKMHESVGKEFIPATPSFVMPTDPLEKLSDKEVLDELKKYGEKYLDDMAKGMTQFPIGGSPIEKEAAKRGLTTDSKPVPKATPKNPPSKKQKEMIRSMLRERVMTSEQRQEYMDKLATVDKFGVNGLFNELKALPKAKVALTDGTDPLNQHENPKLAKIKQELAPFDLDGSIRRYIDEKTANGGEVSAKEIRDLLKDNKDFDPTKSYGDYANESQFLNISLATYKTESEKKADEESSAKFKEAKEALKAKLDALKQAQAGLSPLSKEEHQAVLEALAAKITDDNDPERIVRDGILDGTLRTGEDIVAALSKQEKKNENKNLVSTSFASDYKNISADESKDPETWELINRAYALPGAPEGFEPQFIANNLKAYDNENGDLSKLINSGASYQEVLDWLDANSQAWRTRMEDYDTRGYVDLPFPSQKASWKKFGELLSRMSNGLGEGNGEGSKEDKPNTEFISALSERLPENTIKSLDEELPKAFSGDSLSDLLGKIETEEDLERVVDELTIARASDGVTLEQEALLKKVQDATIQKFYEDNPDLENTMSEPTDVIPAPIEAETPSLTISELYESVDDLLDMEGGYPESLFEQVDEVQQGAGNIEALRGEVEDRLESGDREGAAQKLSELADAYDYFAEQVELARELGADAFDDPDFTKENQDKVIADYKSAASMARELAAAAKAEEKPSGPEEEPAVAEPLDDLVAKYIGMGGMDGKGWITRGEITTEAKKLGVSEDEVLTAMKNGGVVVEPKKDSTGEVVEDVVDSSASEIANPYSTDNSDKLLAEAKSNRKEIEDLDFALSTAIDIAGVEYTPMLFGVTGNEHIVKNILDDLDASDGANSIALSSSLYELHQALENAGIAPLVTEHVKELADAMDAFTPAEGGDKNNVVTIDTIKQEQDGVLDLSSWKKVGGQKGSNPGGTYENPETGEQVYVKTPKSQLHGENERLSSALYDAAGISSAKVLKGKLADGTEVTYSPMIDGAKQDLKKNLKDKAYMARLQQGFAMDALLANWDVIGLEFDNVVTDKNGEPVRVDPGGALLFRAQGSPKGGAFGEEVPELDAFTDKTSSRPSAKVFSQMTDEQKLESAKVLQNLSPSQIDELVNSIVTDPAKREELKTKLKARREFILNKFGLTDGGNGGEEPTPSPEAPSAPSESANLDLGDENTRTEAAKSVQEQLPDGYTASPQKGVGNTGFVMVKNSQGETVAMMTMDPDDPTKYAVQNFKAGYKIETAPNLNEAMAKLVGATKVAEEPGQVVQMSDGSTGKLGTKVVHNKNGISGTIVGFQKDPNYVKVKPDNGDPIKIMSINQIKSNGSGGETVSAPTTPNAPEAPQAPEAPEAPEAPSAPEKFTPDKSENFTMFTDSKGTTSKIMVVKTFEGKWDVVYDYNGPDFKPLFTDLDSRDEAEGKALESLGNPAPAAKPAKATPVAKPANAAPTGPKKFTFDFMGLADVTDAPEIKDSGDPLDGDNEKIKADSAGTLIKPGAIVKDENGRVGVYRTTGYGDPNKIRMIWEDGTQDSVFPNTVTATGKYIEPGIAGVYAYLSALDFEKNSAPLDADYVGNGLADKNGKKLGYKQLVVDKNGDMGVVIENSGANGYIKVAYPDGMKTRKADTLEGLDRRYTKDEYNIKISQKHYKTMSTGYSASKYNLPTFGKTLANSGSKAPSGKLTVPKNGAGAKPEGVKTLGWNESDFENAPSLEELLAMVSDTSKPGSGLRGGSIALNSGSVEDLDLRVMAASGTNGEDAFLLKYKLTSWAGDDLANKLVDMVKNNDPRVTVISGLFVPENAIDGDKVSFTPSAYSDKAKFKSGYGETFVITQEDGTKIYFMRADAPTQHKSGAAKMNSDAPKAYHNKVMVIAPKTSTPVQLASALQTAGVNDVRPSTKADGKILIENRLMSIFDEKVDPKSNLSGKEREESLQRIKDKWGISPENVTITTGAGGRIEMRLDPESAKKIVAKTKVKVLRHNLTGGSAMKGSNANETAEEKRERIADYFVSRVASPQGGLLSTTTRWSEGVPTGGMSSQADIKTGGADYVFTTPVHGVVSYNDSLVPLIYFDAERAFQRLDFWANVSDQFGKRTGKSPIDQAVPGGYEVMFKGRLSFDDSELLMVNDQNMRTLIITKLRQKGIKELGGRPLEAVIMTGQDYQALKTQATN